MSLPHRFLLWVLEDLHAVGDLQGWPTFGVCKLGDYYGKLKRAWWVMARTKFSDTTIVKMLGYLANTHEKGVKKSVCDRQGLGGYLLKVDSKICLTVAGWGESL